MFARPTTLQGLFQNLIFLKTKRIYLSKLAQTNLFLTSTLRLNTLCAFLALTSQKCSTVTVVYPHFHISQKRESCQDHCVLLASCLLLQRLYFIITPHRYKTFIMFTPSWYAHCSPSWFSQCYDTWEAVLGAFMILPQCCARLDKESPAAQQNRLGFHQQRSWSQWKHGDEHTTYCFLSVFSHHALKRMYPLWVLFQEDKQCF